MAKNYSKTDPNSKKVCFLGRLLDKTIAKIAGQHLKELEYDEKEYRKSEFTKTLKNLVGYTYSNEEKKFLKIVYIKKINNVKFELVYKNGNEEIVLNEYNLKNKAKKDGFFFIDSDFNVEFFNAKKEKQILEAKHRKNKGSIVKVNDKFKLFFSVDAKAKCLGYFKTKEDAEEARQYFIDVDYDLNKYYESEYYKKHSVNFTSKEYVKQGTVHDTCFSTYSVSFTIKNKHITLGTYKSKEIAEEVRKYFININYDLEEFKKSKYWNEERIISCSSEGYQPKGYIKHVSKVSWQTIFSNGCESNVNLGCYKTKELAEEARQYFIEINYNIEEFKKSKYWLELRNVNWRKNEKYVKKGTMYKVNNGWQFKWYISKEKPNVNLGWYESEELAKEAQAYMISIGGDIDKFKKSKYWLKLRKKK